MTTIASKLTATAGITLSSSATSVPHISFAKPASIPPPASPPVAPTVGQVYWDQQSRGVFVFDGVTWHHSTLSINPPGYHQSMPTNVYVPHPNHTMTTGTITAGTVATGQNTVAANAISGAHIARYSPPCRPAFTHVVRVIDCHDFRGRPTPRYAEMLEWLSNQNLVPGKDYDTLIDSRYPTDVMVFFLDETTSGGFRLLWAGSPLGGDAA